MTDEFFFRKQVIEIFGFEEKFLDELEAEELVRSERLEQAQERVFTRDQMERIRIIDNLVRELEVNLAGVEVILEMRENMLRMQRQFDVILRTIVDELRGKLT
jgi:MerR family transcriptional regulator, heat shock protein HspR